MNSNWFKLVMKMTKVEYTYENVVDKHINAINEILL